MSDPDEYILPAAAPLLLNDGALAECPCCHDLVPTAEVQVRWMNTRYEHIRSNQLESCLLCWEYSEDLWAALWAEYYEGCL
jgi:hypothetical protein